MNMIEEVCEEYVSGHLSDADFRDATKAICHLIGMSTSATPEDAVRYSEAAWNAARAMHSVHAYADLEPPRPPRPPSLPSREKAT